MKKKTTFFLVLAGLSALLILSAVLIWPTLLETSEFLRVDYKFQPLSKAKNRYPILIHHGILPITGLHGFAKDLNQFGCTAFSTQVSAANSVAFRSAQLAEQVDRVLKLTGAEKVNIIGHSMGGLDARFLISSLHYGDRIASLTTLSTPHHGSAAADWLVQNASRPLAWLFNLLGILFVPGSNLSNMDSVTAATNLTSEFAGRFNKANLDDPNVQYFSWAGNAEVVMRDQGWLGQWLMRPVWEKVNSEYGPNDMLVAVESSKWGDYRGEVAIDHFSQIGNRLFLMGGHYQPFAFFRQVCEELAAKGL